MFKKTKNTKFTCGENVDWLTRMCILSFRVSINADSMYDHARNNLDIIDMNVVDIVDICNENRRMTDVDKQNI